jgi:hypothetical protein
LNLRGKHLRIIAGQVAYDLTVEVYVFGGLDVTSDAAFDAHVGERAQVAFNYSAL